MSFVTKPFSVASQIPFASAAKFHASDCVEALAATEPVLPSGKFVRGAFIANAASNAIAASSAVITGRNKGSRSGRSSRRGRVILPMTALMVAGAIGLSPPATHQPPVNYQAQPIRECIWHLHVVLCRVRDGDPPELAKQHHPRPAPLPSTE
jgi:hypothetical protein